jgi:hypothetical protein
MKEPSMCNSRTFDDHVKLFDAYSARVALLEPAAWQRVRQRCAALNGPEFQALVRRALLAAKSHEVFIPDAARQLVSIRVIAGVSWFVQTSIAFVGEVTAEFAAAAPGAPEPPWQRTTSTGNARTDLYIDASSRIETALMPYVKSDPGVVTAVHAAGHAVLRHDWMSPATFDAVYGFMEPEIPFAELERSAGNGASSDGPIE